MFLLLCQRPMIETIRQFGPFDAAADYVLRAGGYSVIARSGGQVAIVSTTHGFYLLGGGQEDGETAEQAAVREASEECGAQIRILDRIGIADELVFAADEGTHFRKRCTFFRAELLSDELTGGEDDHSLVWMSADQAISMLRHESQKWAVAESGL